MLVRKALSSCIAIGVIALGLLTGGPVAAQTCTTAGSSVSCTNSGTISSFFQTNLSDPGTTIATNSGTVGFDFVVGTFSGIATATNTGSVGGSFQLNTSGGPTTGTNSGSVGGSFDVFTAGSGTTVGTNSGSIGGN